MNLDPLLPLKVLFTRYPPWSPGIGPTEYETRSKNADTLKWALRPIVEKFDVGYAVFRLRGDYLGKGKIPDRAIAEYLAWRVNVEYGVAVSELAVRDTLHELNATPHRAINGSENRVLYWSSDGGDYMLSVFEPFIRQALLGDHSPTEPTKRAKYMEHDRSYVSHAEFAEEATHAERADECDEADHSQRADEADEAAHAVHSDEADEAKHAECADRVGELVE